MQPWLILQLLALLLLANGTPVIATKIFGARYSYPLDGNVNLADGRRLFGPAKTIRGVGLAILATMAGAPLIGLGWEIGAVVGGGAMAGDLLSSFCKRRLDLPPSSRASGLDQIPESLFPLLACGNLLPLTAAHMALCVLLFVVGEVLLSRVLYAWRLRDRPY